MNIQQEYFARHKFDVDAVCYPDSRGVYSIVLRNQSAKNLKQPQFIVATTQIHKQETHPTYYKFTQMIPAHDSFGNGAVLKNAWDKKVYYDEWDAFIRQWTEYNKSELIPIKGDELVLAAMEIFLYSHDSWLSQSLGDRQKDNLCIILDETLPISDRLLVARELEEYIRGKNKSVYSSLTGIRAFGEGKLYAEWLEKFL